MAHSSKLGWNNKRLARMGRQVVLVGIGSFRLQVPGRIGQVRRTGPNGRIVQRIQTAAEHTATHDSRSIQLISGNDNE